MVSAPLAVVSRARALTRVRSQYECLLEYCGQTFWSDAERKAHLVASHGYDPHFEFHNIKCVWSKPRLLHLVDSPQVDAP